MGGLLILPHLCIYLIIYLYQYGLMQIQFICWVIIQHYFLSCSNCSIFGHWELIFSYGILSSLCLFLSVSLTFWQYITCSFYIFSSPVVESVVSQKRSDSLRWKMVLETKIQMCQVCLLLLHCPRRQSKEIYVCKLNNMHIHIYKYLYYSYMFVCI